MAQLAATYDRNEHDRQLPYQPTVVQNRGGPGHARRRTRRLPPCWCDRGPGKKLGEWTVGQTVEHPPGYFLVMTNEGTGPYSFAVARGEAEAAAERHMVAVPGVAGWATDPPRRPWIVSEGKELD